MSIASAPAAGARHRRRELVVAGRETGSRARRGSSPASPAAKRPVSMSRSIDGGREHRVAHLVAQRERRRSGPRPARGSAPPSTSSSGSPWASAFTRSPPRSNQASTISAAPWSPERPVSTCWCSSRPKFSSLYARAIVCGSPMHDHVAALEQHRAVAEALDRRHVVRHEDDRLALGLEAVELLEALLLERGVADRQHLVDQQHVGVDLDRDREGEPHRHPRRVVLELEVEELLELGERDDVVEARLGLVAREAEHHRVDQHVVARGQVGVEADAELDERRQPAERPRPSRRWARRSRRGTSAACSCRSRCGRRSRRTRPGGR